MNKTVNLILKISVAAILVIMLLVGVFYYVSYKAESNEVADIVNKGNAYMEAGGYAEAIECYEKALEHEEGNEKLISAIIDANMLLALNFGDTDDAIMYYTRALSYNPNNKTAYWAISNIYENRGDEDTMMTVLRAGFIDTQDETMKQKVDAIEEERARIIAEEEARAAEEAERLAIQQARAAMLDPLVELFVAKDYDGLKEMLRSEEYVAFSDEANGDTSFYSGEYDADNKRTGTGIALYENGYYYYGEFDNDLRNGHGIMMRASYSESSSIGSFIFEGEWANDKPNGNGVAQSNYYKDRISSGDFFTKEIKGNYTDGLEDGDMTLTGKTKSGSARTFTYKAVAGIAEKSSNDDSGVKGQYIIAQTADKSENLTSDGSVRGIEGFIE